MKKSRKVLSLVLAVLMLVSVIPIGVSGLASDDYTQWKQYDAEWNQAEAWPASQYPSATSRMMKDAGCAVTSIAILLRHHNVIMDDVDKFNPWICNEQLKAGSVFEPDADIIWSYVTKVYPGFEFTGISTYSLPRVTELYNQGYACIINVGGHYVALKDIDGTTVNIMDPGYSGRPTLASYSSPSEIIYYKVTPAQVKIKVGDYIQLGNYLGETITWRCVGIDDNGPLMLSEKVICFKSYDAKGNYSNSYRRSNGSNNWAETTLRHWLNSYGEVDWSNRISVPTNENMYHKKGGYDKELGFLSSFSEAELNCIKTVTLKTYLNSLDSSLAVGGTSEYNLPWADYEDFFVEDMASKGKNKWYINTSDKVFVLDPEQMAMCYFNLGEEFAFNPGATEAALENEKTGLKDRLEYSIWMRVPATQGMSYQNNGATIYTETIHKVNSGVVANAEDVGVRPAFYLDLNAFNSLDRTPSDTEHEKPDDSTTEPSTPEEPSEPSTPNESEQKEEGNIFTKVVDFFKNIINKILSFFKW